MSSLIEKALFLNVIIAALAVRLLKPEDTIPLTVSTQSSKNINVILIPLILA